MDDDSTVDERAARREAMLGALWSAIAPGRDAPPVRLSGDTPRLGGVHRVAEIAASATAVASMAGSVVLGRRSDVPPPLVHIAREHAALAFTAERHVHVPQAPFGAIWDPIAGDYPCADGWVRLHTNYRAHRAAARRVLGVDEDRDAVAAALAGMNRFQIEDAVIGAGGVAAAMRTEQEWLDHPAGQAAQRAPLVAIERAADAPPIALAASDRPLAGVRIVELTRVIAGPTATQHLAALGADVMRIESPDFDELPVLQWEGRFGKRSAMLDLRVGADRQALLALVADADVLVDGLRPGALDALGLDVATLRARRGALITASLSAYSPGPWRERRGFDSLVQMVTGIAERGGRALGRAQPSPLPCQAIDYASGYLLSAGISLAVAERIERGGAWDVRVCLDRTARWIADHPLDRPELDPQPVDPTPWLVTDGDARGSVTHVGVVGAIDGARLGWDRSAPVPGGDDPRW